MGSDEQLDADIAHLRAAIAVAAQARVHGNHPFGAVLVGADGRVLFEVENTVLTTHDPTGHAELNLVRLVGTLTREALAASTLYASTEPCAMCAAAIYWAGIGRVVYATSAAQLNAAAAPNPEHGTLDLSCRSVFAAGGRSVEVRGPLLEDEAWRVHEGFWE